MNEEAQAQLRMIGESAADFAAAYGGVDRARRVHEGDASWQPSEWKAMAELGWLAIAVPESAGGLALGASAACVVAEACGRALFMPPLTEGMSAASVLAAVSTTCDAARSVLRSLVAGDVCVACAVADELDGALLLSLVPDGSDASHWLVARGAGPGTELRLLRADRSGMRRSVRTAVDGSRLVDARVSMGDWVEAPCLLRGEEAMAAWSRGQQLWWLSDAAYLAGLTEVGLNLALDYMRLRHQFGVPIGSFQALQHRAADCHVDVTATRALVHEAARAWGGPRGTWAAAAAVHRAAETALRVLQEVIQFHGAIGFADEHDAGLYLRRAMAVGARHALGAQTCLRQGEMH